jgi:hypothetical protein
MCDPQPCELSFEAVARLTIDFYLNFLGADLECLNLDVIHRKGEVVVRESLEEWKTKINGSIVSFVQADLIGWIVSIVWRYGTFKVYRTMDDLAFENSLEETPLLSWIEKMERKGDPEEGSK